MPRAGLFVTLVVTLFVLGCEDDSAQPGEPGGACKLGVEPCVEGYDCINGVCAEVEPDMGMTTYRAELEFDRERVTADGMDAVEFFLTVSTIDPDGTRSAYDPETDGPLFITPIPIEAGQIEPARPVLLDGLGAATFVPCDRAVDVNCPETAIIRVARDDDPLSGIGESARFRLVDPPIVEADAGPVDASP